MSSTRPAFIDRDDGFAEQIRFQLSADLAKARRRLADGKGAEAAELADGAATQILELIRRGVGPGDPLLAYYFYTRLVTKFKGVPNNLDGFPTDRRDAVQVLLFDSTNSQVLLQKRGPFKRQLAECDSVSASDKRKSGETAAACAARAVTREVGFYPDESKFEVIGEGGAFLSHFSCASFYGLSGAEEEALQRVAEQFAGCFGADGIVVRYCSHARSLVVFTIEPSIGREGLKAAAEEIQSTTSIPYIFAFSNTDSNSLLAYRLSRDEESLVKALMNRKARAKQAARERIAMGLDQKSLLDLDADDMHFEPWIKVRCESRTAPTAFALALTESYFPNDEVWAAMGFVAPMLIDISDPMAALVCVSGGKGANSYILRQLARDTGAFLTPPAVVLTTLLYESVVLSVPQIRADIAALDHEHDPTTRKERAERIRSGILAVSLPDALVSEIEVQLNALGSDVAVRSSATFEDTVHYSAAGQADTALHQLTLAGVLAAVRQVWASLFADGYIAYRDAAHQPHTRARMAVLIQSFVHAQVAGVVLSFDPKSERPGYLISAQPGIGEGVVQGQGEADQWLVGLLCDSVLERWIREKVERTVAAAGEGVKREKFAMSSACLNDDVVLRIADASRRVHEHYKNMGLSSDIDIEYAIDAEGHRYILQARSKPSQREVRSDGRPVISVTTVDVSRLPVGVHRIQLSRDSLVAVQGAVTGVLQIDSKREAAACRPGVILVANHTNNDYNVVFGSLAAVITTDGNQTSHAAQHAYEKRIPCVVGSAGAMEQLAVFDGELVTFDAGAGTVYLGGVPITEEHRCLDLWLFDGNRICSFSDEGSRHENHRPWWVSKSKRPVIFVEDFEGHFRRRSNKYCYFQLDYFYKAWDYLNDYLTHAYGARTRLVLKPQGRQIKAVESRHQLVHEVVDDDPGSIYYYLRSVSDFGIGDLEWLFTDRLERFRRFGAFVHGLTRIERSNAEPLVEEILNVFVGMHFGFWLDAIAEDFAAHQLKYINDEASFHNILRDAAIEDDERTYKVDPLNPGIPAGKVLNLSRERDKEIYVLLERIRADVGLFAAFEAGSPAGMRAALGDRYPHILGVIDGWSMKYKLTLEDLDVPSDTDEYLIALQKRLRENNSMNEQLLCGFYYEYLAVHGGTAGDLSAIEVEDRNLYQLCRASARQAVAAKREVTLAGVSEGEIDAGLPEVVDRLKAIYISEKELRAVARRELERYPGLKAAVRVSRLQFPLREDAHHLMVPHQRRIARLMLDAAAQFVPLVLREPKDVFQISTDEFIGLFHEPDPRFIAKTLERWPMLLRAELTLKRCWSVTKEDFVGTVGDVDGLWRWLSSEEVGLINHAGALQDLCRVTSAASQIPLPAQYEAARADIFATLKRPLCYLASGVRAFEACVSEAAHMLEDQRKAATLPRLKASYAAEQSRLIERLEKLKRKAISEGRM